MASADLLLHPVRLRILQAFLGDRALTTTQLADELDDVPAGSLYRHVALLTKAGVLQVVAERRVRAVVERTYTLRLLAARVGPAEAVAMTPEEHSRAFLVFVAGLLADFDRYLGSGPPTSFATASATPWPPCGSPTPSTPSSYVTYRPSFSPGSPTPRARGAGGAWCPASFCLRQSRRRWRGDRGREPAASSSCAELMTRGSHALLRWPPS